VLEQATELGVVEGSLQQQGTKKRRMTMVSLGDVIEAGLFISRWQFCSHRRRVIGDIASTRLASLSPDSPNSLGVWQS
jgi:hypothetical protein